MGICHVKIGLPKKWCGDARDKVASYLGNTARHRRSDWASEVCPTLGCSIEISRDMSVVS